METQIQIVQVEEDVLGDASDGALGHRAEHSVPQLVEEGCTSSRNAIWDSGGHSEFSTPAVKSKKVQTAGLSAIKRESILILNTEGCDEAEKDNVLQYCGSSDQTGLRFVNCS